MAFGETGRHRMHCTTDATERFSTENKDASHATFFVYSNNVKCSSLRSWM